MSATRTLRATVAPACTSLPTNASHGALKRERTRGEDARDGERPTSDPRVGGGLSRCPHRDVRGAERQRQAQVTEEEDAEPGAGDDERPHGSARALAECGPDCESSTHETSATGQEGVCRTRTRRTLEQQHAANPAG